MCSIPFFILQMYTVHAEMLELKTYIPICDCAYVLLK